LDTLCILAPAIVVLIGISVGAAIGHNEDQKLLKLMEKEKMNKVDNECHVSKKSTKLLI